MPIRSPRGRAAAYRAIWQWPLRSPARLGVTAALVLALAIGLSVGLGAVRGDPGTAPSGPGPLAATAAPLPAGASGSAPQPTALPPVPELTPTPLPLSAAPAEALQVAAKFTASWVRPPDGTTSAQWLEGLRPTTTPEYLGVLAAVDPSNVPASKVTGPPQAVAVAPRSVRVQVPTDALTLVLTVVDTDAGWRVSGYDRA